MMQLTEARWSPTVRRLALTTAGFLPVSLALLVVLFFGRAVLWEWVTKPMPVKAAWLNPPFFWLRTFACAGALVLVAYAFIRRLLRDPIAQEEERERVLRNRLATVLLFLWVITLSLWGFDLIMSLDPKWYSGLYGGDFLVSTLYTGFALLSLLSGGANLRGTAAVPARAGQDGGKAPFGVSLMGVYFFLSPH